MNNVLITGGTGSLGTALLDKFLIREDITRIVIFSRDEVKQGEMAERIKGYDPQDKVRFFLGDVRDDRRLYEAFTDIDTVIHAAALKRVDQVSYNPSEVLKTNVLGTMNVLWAALVRKVSKVLLISSDKAVHPANVYGATKLLAEFITIRSNALSASRGTMASVLRYGNVWGSRGSVMERFAQQRTRGKNITVTNPGMTRFFITLPQAVELVERALQLLQGGEIFVPILPKWMLAQVAHAYQPDETHWQRIELRPGGEKLHESLIAREEEGRVIEHPPFYIIRPDSHEWTREYAWDAWPITLVANYTSAFAPSVDTSTLEALR